MVRRRHINSEETLLQYGYSPEEAKLVIDAVHDNCFSHEEFVEALKAIGVSDTEGHIDVAS